MLLLAFDTSTPAVTVALHDGAEVLDQIGMMPCVEVERDDAPLVRILIVRGRDIQIAVATDREMTDRTQAFCDYHRMKTLRQHQPVWFV